MSRNSLIILSAVRIGDGATPDWGQHLRTVDGRNCGEGIAWTTNYTNKIEQNPQEVRAKALSRSLNAHEVEAELRQKIRQTEEKTVDLQAQLGRIEEDEVDVRRKLEHRQRELENEQKRLAKLEVGTHSLQN